MTHDKDPDFWKMLVEQTPVALQYVFLVLTLWVSTVAGLVYRRWSKDIDDIRRIQREDANMLHEKINDMKEKQAEQHAQLLREIAGNRSETRKRGGHSA